MKILFYIHSLAAGGAERVTAILANHWAEQGWLVTIVTVAGTDGDFYELDNRVERIALELDATSANAWQALGNNLIRIRTLRGILKEQRPDAAVAMMTTANAVLAWASLGLPVATIGSERTYPPAMPLGRAWSIIRRWSYPRLSGLVAQTRQSADWLQANAPAPHISVIPNPVRYPLPVHEPRVRPAAVREGTGRSRLLIAVGRLGEEKRFDRLLDAFASASQAHPDWMLVILGEGRQRTSLEHQITSLGLSERVRLPGAVGNVGDWYEAADLYALTSRFEGFPNTLLEALAYGVPAVAVDCETGPREILRHEVDGLLVPQDDQKGVVEALDRLMGDPELRARFAERAVEAQGRFAVSRVAVQWERLFDSLRNGS
ncbi:glycosyltransferase [Guyparkeria halophila]|uniref:Glycosyltransferase n=1 Tax=Guyparkeria halophila TaxID=47960 RepID=A0A6I6CV16_9GAMM|nr:glycosyltransferase family 4 protein [Guyparkeria halophila]QGT78306.1 glycosyltransferase [Guyparkeria halophila]